MSEEALSQPGRSAAIGLGLSDISRSYAASFTPYRPEA